MYRLADKKSNLQCNKGVDFLAWIATMGMEMLLSQRLCLFYLHSLTQPLPPLKEFGL